jgi:hypothetical protein
MFEQLGKMAADNFIKQAADEDYAKYQKQRMADSESKLRPNYMDKVRTKSLGSSLPKGGIEAKSSRPSKGIIPELQSLSKISPF